MAIFTRRLEKIIKPTDRVLDLGAGAGERNAYSLRKRVRQIVGVDLDPRVTRNVLLDSGLIANVVSLPFQDESFDVVFAIYVLEHVDRPSLLASEIARVLRPGGMCLVLTPNLFHYVTLLSRLTPTAFHRWVNLKRGRTADDTFPTRYRLNSRRTLKREFGAARLEAVTIDSIEVKPNYLTFSPIAYACGVAYERLVNSTRVFSGLRVNLIAAFKKQQPRQSELVSQ